jgi:hypothetical protein
LNLPSPRKRAGGKYGLTKKPLLPKKAVGFLFMVGRVVFYTDPHKTPG